MDQHLLQYEGLLPDAPTPIADVTLVLKRVHAERGIGAHECREEEAGRASRSQAWDWQKNTEERRKAELEWQSTVVELLGLIRVGSAYPALGSLVWPLSIGVVRGGARGGGLATTNLVHVYIECESMSEGARRPGSCQKRPESGYCRQTREQREQSEREEPGTVVVERGPVQKMLL
uniref:Uncharacterized protein n=1 Tax=Knipowitschia caucasica TaxID=637954 RepID=A0AAV2LI06_KNICA